MSDFLGAGLTVGFVLVFLILSEGLAKMDWITKESARKLIHISVGNVIFFIPIFETKWIAAAIPAIFVIGNFLLSPMSPIEKFHLRTFKAGHAWGTILYPLSLSIVIYLFFNDPFLIVAAFFPVVYGDGFAAVYGPKAKSGQFTIMGNQKTIIGTTVISFFSLITVTVGVIFLGYSPSLAILLGTLVAIVAPFIELISPTGTDNLVLPGILSGLFWIFQDRILETSDMVDPNLYVLSIGFGLLLAIGGYLTGALTIDGAMAGFVINTMMFGLGGLAIGVQLFLFFILGSGATKIVRKIAKRTQDEFEKGGGRRDAIQATAKAGFPSIITVLLLFNYQPVYFYLISGIIAAALIDTMATEIGIATQATPVHILSPWKKARPGQTGVISLKGTLGGAFFGLIFVIITFITTIFDPFSSFELSFLPFVLITLIGGTFGMLSDSFLGATIQRKNQCQECDKIVEANTHHGQPTVHRKGIRWFNNDFTNIIGSTLGGIAAGILFSLLF